MNATATVARLAMAAYMRQLHAEGTEPELLMNRAVNHADWMTSTAARTGDLQLSAAYAGVTATLTASRDRMYARRPMSPSLIPSGGVVTQPNPAPSDEATPEEIRDAVLRDVLHSDVMASLLTTDAFLNAAKWRFLQAGLTILAEQGLLSAPAVTR